MDFVEDLVSNGAEVYIVGGAVRDCLFGIKPKDIDILVRLVPEESIVRILRMHGKANSVGKSFGIILFTKDGQSIEIALPRKETSIGNGYREFIIEQNHVLGIDEDVKGRDATMNTLSIQITTCEDIQNISQIVTNESHRILDSTGGLDDIKNKIWRAVGNAMDRFVEDYTRIFRCYRQSAQFGLNIDQSTLDAMYLAAPIVKTLPVEIHSRMFKELFRMICNHDCERFLLDMYNHSILSALGVGWTHSPNAFKIMSLTTDPALRLAYLMDSVDTDNIRKWCNDRQLSSTGFMCKNTIDLFEVIRNNIIDFTLVGNKRELLAYCTSIEKKYPLRGIYLVESLVKYLSTNFVVCTSGSVDEYGSKENINCKMYTDSTLHQCGQNNENAHIELPNPTYKIQSVHFHNNSKCDRIFITGCGGLKELVAHLKDYPISHSQLKLNGKKIMELWPLVEGIEISRMKDILISSIQSDIVSNNEENLIEYVKAYLSCDFNVN